MVRSGGRSRRSDEDDLETERARGNFFACYLLCSTSPRFKGQTYIGFTTNPRRRIRQHNGELTSGAIRTKRKRPWEMVLCIHGFPTNVSALHFEWAWQHPRESLAVRKSAATMKSLSGVANKVKIAYTMLTLPSWEHLNLTVNYFSSNNVKYVVGCPSLPTHMRLTVLAMDQLSCYNHSDDCEEDRCEFTTQPSSEASTTSDAHQVPNFMETTMDHQFPYHHHDDQDCHDGAEFAIQPSSEISTTNVQVVPNFMEFALDHQFSCYHHGGTALAKKPPAASATTAQVIDLSTPPNCKLSPLLIDLTRSPIPIIQL